MMTRCHFPPHLKPGDSWLPSIAILGAVYLGILGVASWTWFAERPFGWEIYDAYYFALLDGRFDLPARILRFEGHYLSDGTGYLYHGLAPLLTRFALGWAWPFDITSMSVASVWVWGVVGTIGWQSTLTTLARATDVLDRHRPYVIALTCALWLIGPATLLVVHASLFHEPIAVAYAMAGVFAAVWTRAANHMLRPSLAVAVLAACAVVALHARPNVAIGLYLGVVLFASWCLWHQRASFVAAASLAMLILALGGLSYLGINHFRFGDAITTHGSFTSADVQYGNVFWGRETEDSPRAMAFLEHGTFNALRIIPNGALYLIDIHPISVMEGISDSILATFRAVTEPLLGFIRVEAPRIGILLLWPLWCILAFFGVIFLRRDPKMAGLVICFAVSAGITLSYGTVTLRYKIDFWPFLSALALIGAVGCLDRLSVRRSRKSTRILFFSTIAVGLVATMGTAYFYGGAFRERPGTIFGPWDEASCLDRASDIGLTDDQAARTCRPSPFSDDAT